MQAFLRFLAQSRLNAPARYGLPVAAVALATLTRLFAPLDVAPFLLYLPIVFLATLALGRGPGLATVVASFAAAAWFFLRDDLSEVLTAGQVVALGQFLVVAGAMVLLCDALRRAIVENERTLLQLADSQEALRGARDDAEAARTVAEDANRAKSEFLANMSHELRTPLSAIIGYAEMLSEEAEDGAAVSELADDIAKIEGNARHLLGLINDVLDISKIESGKMEVYAETFAVDEMLRGLAATAESLVAKKGNRLHVDLAPGLGLMHTDLTKTRQILLNFLSNAAKFTEGGDIRLSARRGEDDERFEQISFSVSDTGIGMTEEQASRLFQRFQQADASTTRQFGGTGLGLALTRAFADMMGGTVGFTSAPGAGSTFTLTVPATYVEPSRERTAAEASALGTEASDGEIEGDLILVIDDDPHQCDLAARVLRREGFRVRAATNGRSGLDLARQLRPRAILLDVMMPGVDGWSVLSQIKADEDLSKIPVVMVSTVDRRDLAASLGAADYMVKPVDWDRFRTLMDRFRADGRAERRTVLLVEDDVIARMAARQALEDAGWNVVDVGDGEQALRSVEAARPDVVIIDLNMPVLDGFAFLPRFRELPGCAEVPVIVITGRALSVEDRRALRGANQILNEGDVGLADLGLRLRELAG